MLLDLFTVKFLLSYAHPPAHFFGKLGPGLRAAPGPRSSSTWAYIRLFADTAIWGRPLLLLGFCCS